MEGNMKIDGIYQKTLFRNIKSGYAYFQFKSLKYDDDGENFYKCRGVIPNYAPKTPLTLIGHKEDNGKETIFIVEEISLNINNDVLTKSFIMAHLEAGMGSVCADRVVAYLKIHNMTIETLLQSDDSIKHMEQIKGFSHKKAISFVKKAESSLIEMGLLKELSPYGFSFVQINRLRKLYERSVRTEIKENPYLSMRRAEILMHMPEITVLHFVTQIEFGVLSITCFIFLILLVIVIVQQKNFFLCIAKLKDKYLALMNKYQMVWYYLKLCLAKLVM